MNANLYEIQSPTGRSLGQRLRDYFGLQTIPEPKPNERWIDVFERLKAERLQAEKNQTRATA